MVSPAGCINCHEQKEEKGGRDKKRRKNCNTVHVFLVFLRESRILFLKKKKLNNTKYIPTHLSH